MVKATGTKRPLRPGDHVRLKAKIARGRYRQWTTIHSFIPGIDGGVRLCDALERSRGWNVADLERVDPKAEAKKRRKRNGKSNRPNG